MVGVVYWSKPVRVVRRFPTIIILFLLIVFLASAAVVDHLGSRWFAVAGAIIFGFLLLEVGLPHKVQVFHNGVRVRSGVHRTVVAWRDVSGVRLRASRWLGVDVAELVFQRSNGNEFVVPDFRLHLQSWGARVGAVDLEKNLRFFVTDWERRER